MTVSNRTPSHLRLHSESVPSEENVRPLSDDVAGCLDAFTHATGWAIKPFVASHMGSPQNKTSSRLAGILGRDWELVESHPIDSIVCAEDMLSLPMVGLAEAETLLRSIQSLIQRLEKAEEAVRRQEAELATHVAVSWKSDDQLEMAERLEAVLHSASDAIGATASAMYLLDESTSTLKMRACSGLPLSKLAESPRPLRGSLGDLEALLGNAVMLEDIALVPEWQSPEPYGSAICVPIGTPTMPHGTVWFWSEMPRKYSSAEIEVANLASSRLMSELERVVLGNEVQSSRAIRKQLDAAGLAQASRLPSSQPLHSDFEVDGWTFQDGSIGGGFHDWDVNPRGNMVFAVGQSTLNGPEGAIVSSSIHSIIRAAWPSSPTPMSLMQSLNDTLWGNMETDWSGSACLLHINPETGHGSLCNAGTTQVFIVSHRGFRPIGQSGPFIARQPDPTFFASRFVLQPGEVLVAFSATVVDPPGKKSKSKQKQLALGQDALLQTVRSMLDDSASDIASSLARLLPTVVTKDHSGVDRSLLVVRNAKKP